MTPRLALLAIAALALPSCAPDNSAEVAALRESNDALEKRVELLEKAATGYAVARTDSALASTLAVVQAVGRGQDPTSLPATDQVGFCRATGWTVRDLAQLGQIIRGTALARQAAFAECKKAGIEQPNEEQLLATEAGKQLPGLVQLLQHVHEHLDQGIWTGAREHLAKGLDVQHAAAPAPVGDGGGDGG